MNILLSRIFKRQKFRVRKVRCVVRATERKLSFWSMQMSTKLKTAYFSSSYLMKSY